MLCPNCGKEMAHFWKFFQGVLTSWYECAECGIWEEDKT